MKSKFRTIEVSNPEFESDNLRFITVKTPNLKGRGDICLYVPSISLEANTPLTILLHGVYGSAWIWSQKAGIHRTAEKMISNEKIKPAVIAMPSDGLWGDGSAYLPHNSLNFEKWIVEDVIEAVKEVVDEVTDKSKIFIAGLSMGGYGALRIGAKYSHVFSGFSGHSSITDVSQMSLFVEETLDHYKQVNSKEESVLEVIKMNKTKMVPFRFDCGKNDELIEYNRKLHQEFLKENISHIYEEFSGKHEWKYWENHVKDSLLFFDKL